MVLEKKVNTSEKGGEKKSLNRLCLGSKNFQDCRKCSKKEERGANDLPRNSNFACLSVSSVGGLRRGKGEFAAETRTSRKRGKTLKRVSILSVRLSWETSSP